MSLGTILVRADASPEIGTGHVMRCIALGQTWQDQGGQVAFLSAESTASIIARLSSENFATHNMDESAGTESDARETIRCALSYGARWVIADGYRFGPEYQRLLKAGGLRLLCLDDNAEAARYFADIILNQNLHARECLYSRREAGTRLLLGPKFNLLRREFNSWRGWQREIRATANRLLIAMGGTDPRNLNSVVYKAMESADDNRITVKVATGGSNPRIAMLRAMSANSRGRVQLEIDADMPGLMRWADMAIAAAGATCWEMCMLGLPALLIDAAENQTAIARSLADADAAVHLGNWREMTPQKIAAAFQALRLSPERRQMLSESGRALVDGYGAMRVVNEIRKFDRGISDRELEFGRHTRNLAQTR